MSKSWKKKEIIIILSVILIIAVIICVSTPIAFIDYEPETSESLCLTGETSVGAGENTEEITDITDITELTEAPAPQETTGGPPAVPHPTEPPIKKNRNIYRNKFDALRAKYNNNKDIVGLIKIPGTKIYYPVAQSKDNIYYLDRNLYKQLSLAGSIMMDFENDVSRSDPNTVLYGHQMSATSGTMFHALNYYRDENFFNNHRYVIFNTIYEDNVWEVFAFFKTHTSFNYIKVFFKSEKQFLDLAAEMKRRSIYDTGIEIQSGDRILTLSTCTNIRGEPDTRYVLCARMIKNKDDIPGYIAEQMATAVENFK